MEMELWLTIACIEILLQLILKSKLIPWRNLCEQLLGGKIDYEERETDPNMLKAVA